MICFSMNPTVRIRTKGQVAEEAHSTLMSGTEGKGAELNIRQVKKQFHTCGEQ